MLSDFSLKSLLARKFLKEAMKISLSAKWENKRTIFSKRASNWSDGALYPFFRRILSEYVASNSETV
jgi:hypothetical protein